MGKVLKYLMITGAATIVLIIAAIIVVPTFVSIEQFKPKIEHLITEKTGFPMTIGGEISLSLFPWVGVSLSDVSLDNPGPVTEKRFISVKRFEAHMKLLPLLSKTVEVRRFIVDQPEVVITRNNRGIWNWQKEEPATTADDTNSPAQRDTAENEPVQPEAPGSAGQEIGLEALVVGESSLKNGTLIINDMVTGQTRSLSAINLELKDVSFDQPIIVSLQALLDGESIDLQGEIGPVTTDPLTAVIPFKTELDVFGSLMLSGSGSIEQLATTPACSVTFELNPFNPKQLMDQLGFALPEQIAANENGFESFGATGTLFVSPKELKLMKSQIQLDESTIEAELGVTDFQLPTITFNVTVDSLAVDSFLPPGQTESANTTNTESSPSAKTETKEQKSSTKDSPQSPESTDTQDSQDNTRPQQGGAAEPKIDFGPLQKLTLVGTVQIATITYNGGRITEMYADLEAEKGVIQLPAFKAQLYDGSINSSARLDLNHDRPKSEVEASIDGVQVGPLLRDFADKDILEGAAQVHFTLTSAGLNPDQLKAQLNGNGDLRFADGALIGIDLAQLARKISSGFRLDDQAPRPRTDFAELSIPLTISDGVATTTNLQLKSPFIRVTGAGDVDLVDETLDLRLKPRLVGTIKGQGDKQERAGVGIPIIVGGTFKEPSFTPDLGQLVKDQNIDEEEIVEIIKTGEITPERKQQLSEEVEKAKSLLKGLFGN